MVHCAPGLSTTEAELREWLAPRVAAFMIPVKIVFSEETLPRTATGKILKSELRKLFVPAESA